MLTKKKCGMFLNTTELQTGEIENPLSFFLTVFLLSFKLKMKIFLQKIDYSTFFLFILNIKSN